MKSVDEVRAELTAPGQLFEMEEVDIRGTATRVWKYASPSLRTVLENSRGHGDKTYIVYEDERLTFEEHFRHAATFARRLTERYGVRKGDRVAIAMRNRPEWFVAFWGAAAIGAVVVPLNAWWTGPELEYGLRDSGASVLVADEERAGRLTDVLPDLGLAVIVVRGDGTPPPGADAYDTVLGEVTETALPAAEIGPEDDATIFYTSGTTGRPKGALGTQRNITGNTLSLAYAMLGAGLQAGGRIEELANPRQRITLTSLPLFHATGCHTVLVASAVLGSTIVLMRKWDAERALQLIERERVTAFGGVPTMAWQLLTSPEFDKYDTSSLGSVSYGGSPAPPALVEKIKELLPDRVPSNGYGLTETSAVTTYNSGINYLTHPDSVGPPVPVCDVKVVDPAGAELPVGEVGELLVRGPNVIKGYWNAPEATARSFRDGWFHTGDLARVDAEGFVYIVDRAKDMLIRGGENVYCAEVESAMYDHPAVADAAVIGVPHEALGEEVGAVVCLRPGMTVTPEELQAFLRERIASFKVPTHIWFREGELPRNPAGKILKTKLRTELVG
ncbi:class I adenylate-forming enzyme family protein [Actinoallomurus rhizosphaericola]|uniref:class I adenylate-forming enzyme family protein n=1 Tax=Actinoallomurus rhizosphaericola TaxID=2952536 RepID=UPI0020938347|nr:class I adenylate-forming enzyme family protein [Actinoallomurus rhizosphaericola]MCO5998256.1 acyl--CoA ligase [Actinoallomurus rhizosphaericola]